MTATAAEALELALWLHRAPARRAALLGRPLPDGIGQLLRVATGARDQVAAAAMITGEDEATVLEAVRFYLQQILFHEGADDYRVLGLERGASHAQARDHHRLLQQWLHPDRSGNDTWETVYASRVNRAWGHLKTPQARATYDASVVPATAIGGRHGGEYQAVPTSVHAPVPRGNRSRNATLLVLLGCVGLLVLIAMRQDEPPEWRDLRPSLAAATSERKPDEIRAGLVETVGAAPVEAVAAVDAQARVETIEPSPVRDTPTAAPAPAPAPAPAHALAHAPVVAVRPAATPMPVQAPAPGRPASPRPTASPVAVADPPPPRRPVPQPVVVRQAQAVAPSAAVPVAPILVAAVQQAGPPPPRAPAPASVPDAFDRMNQARRRADQVIAYLSDTAAASPAVWNDLRTLEQARQVRTALHDRHGGRTLPFELQAPKWHLAADGARLDAAYRIDQEQGRFGLDFTWREDQLLVRAMTLVPEA